MQVILYALLIVAAIAFFGVGFKNGIKSCFGYSFGSLCLLTGIYIAANFPDIKIKTPGLEYERKIDKIASTQEELKKIVTTLIKMNLAIEDGIGRWGDNRPQRDKLINKYKKEIESYLPSDLEQQLKNDLDSVNNQ